MRLSGIPTLVALALLLGCDAAPTPAVTLPTVTPINIPATAVVARPEPTVPPTPTTARLAIADGLSDSLRAAIEQIAKSQKLQIVPAGQQAAVSVGTQQAPGAILLSEQFYAAADRFATLRSGIALASLRDLWRGKPTADGLSQVLVTEETASAMALVLGPAGPTVRRVSPDQVVPLIWQTQGAIAIVPFDQLEPKLAALAVDGQNVLSRTLQTDGYPLTLRVWVAGSATYVQPLVDSLRPKIAPTNRETERMTTVVMTGVTAMARYTAYRMDQVKDPAYPARKIADVLSSADITHISNEIPFVDNCPRNLDPDNIVLCSKPSYIAAMKLVGTDIVGLTGNHMLDFGADNFLKTLDLYDKEGMKYYGGGRDAKDASRVLVIEDHGNRIAFLGANSWGPASDWATDTQPGAQPYDPAAIKREIAEGRQKADLVFVEYQAEETYDFPPSPNNQVQFRRTLSDGADVVTGVQAHHPQAIEFSADGKRIILYGLGNLWFDQMFNDGVRQGLIPRHTIYQGKLIQTELLTTMLEDYSQPRWATAAERETILRGVFGASGFTLP